MKKMSVETAKCILLDVASYARWRKDEPLPSSLSDTKVIEAIEVMWKDTFGVEMDFVEYGGMHMPKPPEMRAREEKFIKENVG